MNEFISDRFDQTFTLKRVLGEILPLILKLWLGEETISQFLCSIYGTWCVLGLLQGSGSGSVIVCYILLGLFMSLSSSFYLLF